MQPFHLDFAAPEYNPTDVPLVITAPGFRLDPPNTGRIRCHIEGADFLPIRMSNVHPPLADLWLWSVAVASGLLPVTVHINEEGTEVIFAAEALPEGHLRLSLTRREDTRSSFDPGRVIDAISWTEERRAFLVRWGALWATYCLDDTLPWIEWESNGKQRLPEPMRDMPWGKLADFPELEAPPWTYPQRIAWFYLSMAHHLRSLGHGSEYAAMPAYWTLREMACARLSIRAAQSAWAQLRTDAPPAADTMRLIDDAFALALESPAVSAQGEPERRLSLDRAYLDAVQATFAYIADIVEACLPQLPIGAGSYMADECGRRAVILRTEGRDWLFYWDDGRISLANPFYAHHRPAFHWPVAHGPAFDIEALDTIDRRLWRFYQLGISPVGLVCPVCGYPCMDDDTAEVQSCEFCGFALWRLLFGDVPPMDDLWDDKAQGPSLRQLRANFIRWGHSWRPDEPIRTSSTRAIEAQPTYRQLVREAMAEWDAWLENPDPAHTPEEVWRRWKRWRGIE